MNILHKVLELWPGHESGTYGRTGGWMDGRTDRCTGQTGVTLNALPLFFENRRGHNDKTLVPWLCSRSQPGIRVIIRDLWGHLLHTVTVLVFIIFLF